MSKRELKNPLKAKGPINVRILKENPPSKKLGELSLCELYQYVEQDFPTTTSVLQRGHQYYCEVENKKEHVFQSDLERKLFPFRVRTRLVQLYRFIQLDNPAQPTDPFLSRDFISRVVFLENFKIDKDNEWFKDQLRQAVKEKIFVRDCPEVECTGCMALYEKLRWRWILNRCPQLMKQVKIIQSLDKKELEKKKENWPIPDWVEQDSKNRKMKKQEKIKKTKTRKNKKSCQKNSCVAPTTERPSSVASNTSNASNDDSDQPVEKHPEPAKSPVQAEECDCTSTLSRKEVNDVIDSMHQLNQTLDQKVQLGCNDLCF